MLYFCADQAGTYFRPAHFVFFMALIRYFSRLFLLPFLFIFSTAAPADLDPDISLQIGEFDSILTKNEKLIKRADLLTLEELKEIEPLVIKIRSQTGKCINYNQDNIAKIEGEIELLGDIAGIEIPFPQSDLHLKSSEVDTSLRNK